MKLLKRTFLFAILMSMVGIRATAHDVAIENGDGVTIYYLWNQSHTELSVSYKGLGWSVYANEYKGSVVIPASVTIGGKDYPVTSIEAHAFEECTLSSVTIPNSVTSIGENAFCDCSSLASVDIPNSVTSIGEYALDCKWYDNQSNGLVYAGLVAYSYKGTMPSNANIIIENGTLGIADGAFRDCSRLVSIDIPNSVTTIGKYAFYGCSGLTSIDIPNSVSSIGKWAFYDCSGLTSINIPNSVTSIGTSAFYGTAWYNNQSNGLIYAGLVAYSYKGTMPSNTTITLQEGTLGIAESAFSSCSSLTSIEIPNSVSSIGESAFYGCSSLTSIVIPNSVTSINNHVFDHCTGMTSVVIPTSVTSIGIEAFRYCSSLTSMTVERGTPLKFRESAFSSSNYKNATLYVPVGSKAAYEVADYWKDFNEILERTNLNNSDISVDPIGAVTYSGLAQTPIVTMKDKSTTLTNGTDYTASYSNNTNVGTATVTITGMGNYIGTKTVNFTINKAALTITAKSYTIKQGDPLPEYDVTYTGFKNAETSSVLTVLPTISCNATVASESGTYDINVSGADAPNYTMTYIKGTLTINPISVNYTLNALGKGTFCSEYDLDFSNVGGIEAYIISGFNPATGNLVKTRVYEVPAGTGLYIEGTAGETYSIPVEATDYYYSNMMKGITVASNVPTTEDGYTNYILMANGNGGVWFVKSDGTGQLAANRAYVQIPNSMAQGRRRFGIEDEYATSINDELISDKEETDGDYYNLNGQKIQNLQKGIYIRNGKKVIIH